jgi:peroxiredoxin/mono/diheme cytochrome c family protein
MSRAVSLVLFAGLALASSAAADDLPTDRINKKIDRLTLTALDGKPVAVTSIEGKKAVVVLFLSFDCPVSASYSDQLAAMARDYAAKGVAFVGVVAGDEPPESIARSAADYKLGFPLYADPKLEAADALKATTVPEAFVLDHNFVLRYRGRIDDGYAARLKRNAVVTSHDLKDALDALLAGKDVPTPVTQPVGCPVGRREVEAKPGAAGGVTFHKHVLPILQANCQRCHRPGQVGPFSLMTYRHAVNWAEDIKEYTASRQMPPWKPVGGPGYANSRQMSDADIKTLADWVDAGCPEGDPKDAPPPLKFSDEWQLGPPDLVLEVPEDFHVGPSGRDIFRCFVLPTGLTEDRYVVGYEVKPGNPRVVHHTLNYYDASGQGRALEERERNRRKSRNEQDHGPGYSVSMGLGFLPPRTDPPQVGGLGGWAPGQMATRLPDGAGFYLPKGSDLIVQTHYHRTGKPETDRLKIGLYFADKPVEKVWQTLPVSPPLPNARQLLGLEPAAFEIPAGKPDHRVKGSLWILNDATVHSVIPHMHLIGKSIKVTMTSPDGETVTLVDIPEWDYNWQETYWFKTPLKAKAGTRFDVEGVYDNSLSNPNNPFNPPRKITFGEETTNEMLFGFVGVTPDGPGRVRASRTDPKKLPPDAAAPKKDRE